MKTLGIVTGARIEERQHCGELVQVVTLRKVNFNRKSVGWFERVEDHACPVVVRMQRVAKSMRDLFDAEPQTVVGRRYKARKEAERHRVEEYMRDGLRYGRGLLFIEEEPPRGA